MKTLYQIFGKKQPEPDQQKAQLKKLRAMSEQLKYSQTGLFKSN